MRKTVAAAFALTIMLGGVTACGGSDEPDVTATAETSTAAGNDATQSEPFAYGDDAALDALWDACEGGDMAACDDLYMDSPFDSEYETFGDTCGDTTDGSDWCDPAREGDEPFTYGDDAALDALWDACEGGDMAACDDLYMDSPFDSEYETFGDTCGGTTDGEAFCDI